MPDAHVPGVAAPAGDRKQRLLVCAYAFSPVLGSEFAQGWNYVQQMRDRYGLTVLVGSADGRMGDWSLLDHPAVHSLGDDVRIVPVEMDSFCRFMKALDVRLGMSWLFVLGLRRWHQLALRRAEALHREQPFAAVHQLGPVGFRNPGYLHRLEIPSYWGPIGGLQYVDLSLAFRSSPRYGLTSLLRNVSTYLAARSAYVRAAVKGFDRLSFATSTNEQHFRALYGVEGPVMSDQAAPSQQAGGADSKPAVPPLNIVWCGSIDARKNIRLLLDVATALDRARAACRITVVGSGKMLPKAKAIAAERKLGNLVFTGQIPRDQVQAHFRDAHVLCFTSLSEANTSTFFEALAAGCIPVSLDLDGFSTNITAEVGFKITTRQAWKGIVSDFTSHLSSLAADAALRDRLSDGIRRNFERYTWKTLAARHDAIIKSLVPESRS